MKKITQIHIVLFLIALVLLVGCSSKSDANLQGELTDGTLLATFENYHLTIYKELSAARTISFGVISSEELSEVDVKIDVETPYEISMEKISIETDIPYYVYQNFRMLDWKRMYELHYQGVRHLLEVGAEMDNDAVEKFTDFNELYREDYERILEKKNYKNIYYYQVILQFQMEDIEIEGYEVFEEIFIIANGVEYKFDIGKIELDYATDFDIPEYLLSPVYIGAWGKAVEPNSKGEIVIDDMEFISLEDLVVTDIRVINDNVEIAEITITTDKDGVSMDRTFNKGEGMHLQQGTTLYPKVVLNDKNFINTQSYSNTIYLVIEYEIEGNSKVVYFESNYLTRPNVYEFIFRKIENVDFLSYYNDYFNKITEWNLDLH